MLNSASGPNFFREFYQNELDREERAILQKWSEPPPASRDVLYVGCLGKTICRDIDNSVVMKDLPKFGPPDICCGEIHYRAGQWDAYTAIVEKTMARFRELQAERIVFYCGACRTYLGPVLNKVYGKQLPFRLTTIFEWLPPTNCTRGGPPCRCGRAVRPGCLPSLTSNRG
jgi:Fe-S oxidoreductase